jgi:hypothetical protein
MSNSPKITPARQPKPDEKPESWHDRIEEAATAKGGKLNPNPRK